MNNIKQIIKTGGLYSISDNGDVISHVGKNDIVLLPYTNKKGYKAVSLCYDGSKNTVNVHRLVAEAFVDGYEDGLIVNHIDNNPSNNISSNLEWTTYSGNYMHSHEQGRMFNAQSSGGTASGKKRKQDVIDNINSCTEKFNSIKIIKFNSIETKKDYNIYLVDALCDCGATFIENYRNIITHSVTCCKQCRFDKVKLKNHAMLKDNILKDGDNVSIICVADYNRDVELKDINISICCDFCKEKLSGKYKNLFRSGRDRKCKKCKKIIISR